MQHCDFLIIGQGLAGSLMAYGLMKRGQSVMVLDGQHQGCATQVAAGLINPITGHRLNITDRFVEYSRAAKTTYWQMERDLGCSVYRPIPQTRLIKNAGQADYLKQRLGQTDYAFVLSEPDLTDGWFSDPTQHPYGAINVSDTAMVDTPSLLHGVKNWLLERRSILMHSVDYGQLIMNQVGVYYQHDDLSLSAQKVIFCEGHQATHNPWLNHLPFKLAKGEILTVNTQPAVDRMLSWGKWLVPTAHGTAKLGSNYTWNDVSLERNSGTPTQFINELVETVGLNATVTAHQVGIRPSTKQRLPFVGPLSNAAHAYCFNGLGSKGCLIGPHHANALCEHLVANKPLAKEVTQWL